MLINKTVRIKLEISSSSQLEIVFGIMFLLDLIRSLLIKTDFITFHYESIKLHNQSLYSKPWFKKKPRAIIPRAIYLLVKQFFIASKRGLVP